MKSLTEQFKICLLNTIKTTLAKHSVIPVYKQRRISFTTRRNLIRFLMKQTRPRDWQTGPFALAKIAIPCLVIFSNFGKLYIVTMT